MYPKISGKGQLSLLFVGVLAGCAGSDFGGGGDKFSATGEKQASADAKDANAGEQDGVDQQNAGGNGTGDPEADALGDTLGGTGTDEAGAGEPGDSGEDEASGPFGKTPCRLFGKDAVAEKIPGGPPVALKIADLQGTVEGDSFHFETAAFQGCYGAQAKNNRRDDRQHTLATYVSAITGAFFGSETGSALGELSAKGYAAQCGTADQWKAEQFQPYAVKHLYRGVVTNARSADCQVSMTETEKPFWVRENGSETSGCFALGTRIRMADHTDRIASLIREGDLVLNPLTGKSARVTRVVIGPEQDIGMFVVGWQDVVVKVTSTHPFPTAAGLKAAKDLRLSDRLIGADGREYRLARLEQLAADAGQVVINFVINPGSKDVRDHMLLADGIVTGDLYLQQELARNSQPVKVSWLDTVLGTLGLSR